MASIRNLVFMNLLLLFNLVVATLEYEFIGPTPTSVGLVGMQRMAPRPTRPPSMVEINGELRKRRLPDSILSIIPNSWCGFVEGYFGKSEAHFLVALRNKAFIRSDNSRIDNPITCSSSSSCVPINNYYYTSILCSSDGDGSTHTLYERCLGYKEWATMSTRRSSDTTVWLEYIFLAPRLWSFVTSDTKTYLVQI